MEDNLNNMYYIIDYEEKKEKEKKTLKSHVLDFHEWSILAFKSFLGTLGCILSTKGKNQINFSPTWVRILVSYWTLCGTTWQLQMLHDDT